MNTNMQEVTALRQQLEQLFPGKWSAAEKNQKAIPTGLAEIDHGLVRGLYRKQIAEWTGPCSSGKTSFLRAIIANWCASGLNVSYVDSGNKLMAADWSFIAEEKPGKFWVVHPTQAENKPAFKTKDITQIALWSADQLVRCNAFDVVVLDLGNVPFVSSQTYARLQRSLAKSKAALLMIRDGYFSQESNWGANCHLSFRWSNSVQTTNGITGTAVISPAVLLNICRNGRSFSTEIIFTESQLKEHSPHVQNRLFTHPPVPDRRAPKA